MQELVREYLNELGKKQKVHRRFRIVTAVFAVAVAISVIWGLSRAGFATTGEPKCGREEHQHAEECYSDALNCGQEEGGGHQHADECYQTVSNLVCGQEESEEHQHADECYLTESVLACGQEEYPGHTHEEGCYAKQLSCGKEEHQHEEECYIDKSADVEEESTWTAQYEDVEWSDAWGEDLVKAAEAQLDYKESVENYMVAEDGSHKGYTRYGQFAGDPYTDWNAPFVNFCMYYAGLTTSEMFPEEKAAADWYAKFTEEEEGKKIVYITADEAYEPKAGDIVFLRNEEEEAELRMGIVSSYNKEDHEIKVIEGDSDNQVKENTYDVNDEDISEYLKITEMEEDYKGTGEQPNDTPEGEDVNAEVPEEATIELTTEVDETIITLSGPESSFEKDKEYTIQAEKIEDEETIATIEEAIDKEVEKQEKQVKNYQAFDIKLLVDGEEVQPLGPVAVKFSGREVEKSVENENTEVNVIHVDENTGETTDMEAVATDEKDVVIETEHFSVYVYVEVGIDAIEGVEIDIQHWGENIETIDSAAGGMNGEVKEEAFDTEKREVITKEGQCKLYSTDVDFKLPSETYMDVKELSKVYNADKGERYEITKVWVSNKGKSANCKEDQEKWNADDYKEYTKDELADSQVVKEINNLEKGSVIRFWYAPPEKETSVKEPVTFYDYDHSEQNGDTLNTKSKGINADSNFENNNKPKLGVGQSSAGNASPWINNKYNEKFLNAGNGNQAFTGLVGNELNNGKLVFNPAIDVCDSLFSHNPSGGSYQYNDYELEFSQNGDTYTLINVYKGNTKTYAQDLTTFKERPNWNKTKYIYSNDFWPLDDAEHKKDPLLGEKVYQISPNATTISGNSVTKIGRDSGNGDNDFQTANGHNWYFGMTYTVKFKLGDYTGPLEYYFRGDDDFWLFVDGKLAVDLGGIHTAIGKTYNLDYLKNEDKDKEHVLQVYYMERGATGSTCYMQFTLPKAKIEPLPEPDTTTYTVEKKWADNENGFRPQDIQVSLYKKKKTETDGVKVRTITLPLRNEDGKYINQQGQIVDEPIWSYTWSDLPKIDGKTGATIEYYADEEYIDPENQENPMLGYEYDKVVTQDGTHITLTNKIADKRVKVRKEWEGDEKEIENRPEQVVFILYANGTEYKDHTGTRKTVTLSDANNWEGEFDHVPEYYYNKNNVTGEGKWEKVKYSVVEETSRSSGGLSTNGSSSAESDSGAIDTEIGGEFSDIEDESAAEDIEDVVETEDNAETEDDMFGGIMEEEDESGNPENNDESVEDTDVNNGSASNNDEVVGKNDAVYDITIEEVTRPEDIKNGYIACFKATNTLVTKNVCIEKVSKSDETAHLRGAVFNLYKEDAFDKEGNLIENAYVEGTYTTEDNGCIDIKGLRFGVYYLLEIQAPNGFAILEKPIKLTADKTGVTVDFQIDGWEDRIHVSLKGGKYYIEIPNEIMYELPSTGGSGIYWYMFSGMLLMAAGSLITYRKKRKEVLGS